MERKTWTNKWSMMRWDSPCIIKKTCMEMKISMGKKEAKW